MRRLVLVAAFCVAGPVFGAEYEDARQEAYEDALVISTIQGTKSPCAVLGTQVANVMVRRLNGQAMSDQMAEPNLRFFHFVIRDAYKQPFFSDREMQLRLVRDFRERYESECYDVLGFDG